MSELKKDIQHIRKTLEEKTKDPKKDKKFLLPQKGKIGLSRAKQNYVCLMKINENGQIDIKKTQINDQTFMEDGIPRLAAAGYVMYYKKTPMIILPSWSFEPFSPLENYEKSFLTGTNSAGARLLLSKMESEKLGLTKKKLMGGAGKWIIGMVLAVIIGYALVSGS